MNANVLTNSPLWTAAGWTMLHLAWVGVLIGVIAAFLRRLLHPARPETRYRVALLCLVVLSISPLVIFLRVVVERMGQPMRYEMLFALSRSTCSRHQSALAMADRQVMTRFFGS